MNKGRSYIIMGVSGSGKSTIGKLWSEKKKIPFLDADDFHPRENVKKMSEGVPLNDDDRWPWLNRLAEELKLRPGGCVLACSALKDSYRDILNVGPGVVFVFLQVSRDELLRRLTSRSDHFMPPTLLDSQFEALETPNDAIIVDADQSPDEIIAQMERACD